MLKLPRIGFGTAQLGGKEARDAVRSAIATGYRLIDTAYNYENEGAVGAGIKASGVDRSELLITSKLPGRYHDNARQAIEESIFRLGVDQIDLYLIHWPNPKEGKFIQAWEALLDAKRDGLIRHAGVSNFTQEHVAMLIDATGAAPAANQIELHPLLPQDALVKFHQEHDIVTQAWSPLGRDLLLENRVLEDVAAQEGITIAELVLAWVAARGVVPLVRSSSAPHQEANLKAVDIQLSEEALRAVDALAEEGGTRLWSQDPNEYQEF